MAKKMFHVKKFEFEGKNIYFYHYIGYMKDIVKYINEKSQNTNFTIKQLMKYKGKILLPNDGLEKNKNDIFYNLGQFTEDMFSKDIIIWQIYGDDCCRSYETIYYEHKEDKKSQEDNLVSINPYKFEIFENRAIKNGPLVFDIPEYRNDPVYWKMDKLYPMRPIEVCDDGISIITVKKEIVV